MVHLLVVEDDARLSRLLKRLLTQDRHVVETALTAEDGLEIATSTAELDTVILYVRLPDRSCFEVILVLHGETRHGHPRREAARSFRLRSSSSAPSKRLYGPDLDAHCA